MATRGVGPTSSDGAGDGTTRRILIVDDDAPIRAFVKQALAGEGYDVREASDGAAALATVEREPVDLVLLDLWMPVMDGWQFAEAYGQLDEGSLPGKRGRPPLVVFTAERGIQAAEHAERVNAVGFLSKPFDIDELLDVVERCARGGGPDGDGPVGPGEPVGPRGPVDATKRTAAPDRPDGAGRANITERLQLRSGAGTLVADGPVGRMAGIESSGANAPGGKLTREEIQRQQHVERLRTRLGRLQEDMGRVRTGVTKVAEIETSRKLSRDEAKWASQLRMQSEQLRYELQLLRDEFYRLKDERGPAEQGGATRQLNVQRAS